MAFTIGTYGIGRGCAAAEADRRVLSRRSPYLSIVVLGAIFARCAVSASFAFMSYIREEILIVLGTSSSEAALPQMLEKLERLGCSKRCRRTRHPGGLFVQSRRHEHLPDDGGAFHRPGDQYRTCPSTQEVDARGRGDADVERGERRGRRGVRHAHRELRSSRPYPGVRAWC